MFVAVCSVEIFLLFFIKRKGRGLPYIPVLQKQGCLCQNTLTVPSVSKLLTHSCNLFLFSVKKSWEKPQI